LILALAVVIIGDVINCADNNSIVEILSGDSSDIHLDEINLYDCRNDKFYEQHTSLAGQGS
jgi:hypothetical protein